MKSASISPVKVEFIFLPFRLVKASMSRKFRLNAFSQILEYGFQIISNSDYTTRAATHDKSFDAQL